MGSQLNRTESKQYLPTPTEMTGREIKKKEEENEREDESRWNHQIILEAEKADGWEVAELRGKEV